MPTLADPSILRQHKGQHRPLYRITTINIYQDEVI